MKSIYRKWTIYRWHPLLIVREDLIISRFSHGARFYWQQNRIANHSSGSASVCVCALIWSILREADFVGNTTPLFLHYTTTCITFVSGRYPKVMVNAYKRHEVSIPCLVPNLSMPNITHWLIQPVKKGNLQLLMVVCFTCAIEIIFISLFFLFLIVNPRKHIGDLIQIQWICPCKRFDITNQTVCLQIMVIWVLNLCLR